MIFVADSHLSDLHPSRDDFFAMLAQIEQTGEDVILLGDILDLWIGAPAFLNETSRRLLDWCRRERAHRRIGLLEGNHEFYVGRAYGDCFTFWARAERREGDLLFAHGDLVNQRDYTYRLLRLVTKNPLSRLFFGYLPGGRKAALAIKHKLGEAGKTRKKFLPEAAVQAFADRWFAQGVRRIFLGHFHQEHRYEGANGGICQIVPSWQVSGQVVRYDEGADRIDVLPWQEL